MAAPTTEFWISQGMLLEMRLGATPSVVDTQANPVSPTLTSNSDVPTACSIHCMLHPHPLIIITHTSHPVTESPTLPPPSVLSI